MARMDMGTSMQGHGGRRGVQGGGTNCSGPCFSSTPSKRNHSWPCLVRRVFRLSLHIPWKNLLRAATVCQCHERSYDAAHITKTANNSNNQPRRFLRIFPLLTRTDARPPTPSILPKTSPCTYIVRRNRQVHTKRTTTRNFKPSNGSQTGWNTYTYAYQTKSI